MARKTSGRQKVEMKKMTKESNLQVTFSKRRAGLFKKASELCTLTGTEVAVLVFSPGKKAYSFGHPCVDTVVDRFLSGNINASQTSSPMQQFIQAHRNENVRELNKQFSQVLHELDMKKKQGEELTKMSEGNWAQNWWEAPIEELTLPQLQQLRVSLEELRNNISNYLLFQAPDSPAPPDYASSSTGGGVPALPFNLMFLVWNPNLMVGPIPMECFLVLLDMTPEYIFNRILLGQCFIVSH